jgi:exopolysaccharide production protein ExoQ
MAPNLALLLAVLYIFWLLLRDRRQLANVSIATWIPTIWVIIVGSRPISYWLGIDGQAEGADIYIEDSPIDRLVFLCLIVAAFLTLKKRCLPWRSLSANNKYIILYFLYFGISVLWSDFPFVAFKRWIKDIGNVFMVLVILSEPDPIEAVKAVFRRCLYFLVPMSIILIKYFPELAHHYDPWEGQKIVTGIALSKNSLGHAVAICTLFLVWQLLHRDRKSLTPQTKTLQFDLGSIYVNDLIDIANILLLFGMAIWLLVKGDSATAVSCAILGSAGLAAMSLPLARKWLVYFTPYLVVGGGAVFAMSQLFDLKGTVLQLLGRDATLTGRTEIWGAVLSENINPLIGAGYYSFFMGPRVERFAAEYSFYLNQAHNGYIQTYLDGGIIGVCFLGAMLLSAGWVMTRQLMTQPEWASARIIFWLIILVSNYTEATFSRLGLSWLVLLLVMIEYPRTREVQLAEESEAASPETAPLIECRSSLHSPG